MSTPIQPDRCRLQQPEGLQDMLLYRINRLRAVGGGMVLRYCEGRFGITRREWVMLAHLSASGPIQSSKLARIAELDKSATSKAVTAMTARGLVERTTPPGDRRFVELRLTAKGQRLYRSILPVVEDINRQLMSGLQVAQIEQLDWLLDRLQQEADAAWKHVVELPLADRRHGGSRKLTRNR